MGFLSVDDSDVFIEQLCILFQGSIHLAQNISLLVTKEASENNYSSIVLNMSFFQSMMYDIIDLIIQEEENQVDVLFDQTLRSQILEEIIAVEDINNSICPLYDIFLYVCSRLRSLKDDIIVITPSEFQNNRDLVNITNKNTGVLIFISIPKSNTIMQLGRTSAASDICIILKCDQYGAVCPIDMNLPNETIDPKSSE